MYATQYCLPKCMQHFPSKHIFYPNNPAGTPTVPHRQYKAGMSDYHAPALIYASHKRSNAACVPKINSGHYESLPHLMPHTFHKGTKSHMIVMRVLPFAPMAWRCSRGRCTWQRKQKWQGHVHHTLNPFWKSRLHMAHSTDRKSATTFGRSKCNTTRQANNTMT